MSGPVIWAAHDELVAVIQWIDGNVKQVDVPGDTKSLIAAGCFDVVLEHQASVMLNVEKELYGSALSMLRIMGEGFIRGMWFARCATDEDAERFKATDFAKRLPDLVTDVQAALDGKTDVLSRMVSSQWGHLSGFTHTGFKQITRRFRWPMLTPNYPDSEIVQGLRFAGAIGLMAACELMALSNNETVAKAVLERAKAYAPKWTRHGVW